MRPAIEIRGVEKSFGAVRTIVLVTHHFEEVEAICHRVAVLVKGRIAALDTKLRLASGQGGLEAAVMDVVRAEGP